MRALLLLYIITIDLGDTFQEWSRKVICNPGKDRLDTDKKCLPWSTKRPGSHAFSAPSSITASLTDPDRCGTNAGPGWSYRDECYPSHRNPLVGKPRPTLGGRSVSSRDVALRSSTVTESTKGLTVRRCGAKLDQREPEARHIQQVGNGEVQ